MSSPADIVGHVPPLRVVVCGSSQLVDEIAAVVRAEQEAGHEVIAPAFTGDQPTQAQQGEIYNAQACEIPVRLINGELMSKRGSSRATPPGVIPVIEGTAQELVKLATAVAGAVTHREAVVFHGSEALIGVRLVEEEVA